MWLSRWNYLQTDSEVFHKTRDRFVLFGSVETIIRLAEHYKRNFYNPKKLPFSGKRAIWAKVFREREASTAQPAAV